jgi:hypothetical protein
MFVLLCIWLVCLGVGSFVYVPDVLFLVLGVAAVVCLAGFALCEWWWRR